MTSLPVPQESPTAVCVAFSGGLDSSVLLHWLAHLPRQRRPRLRALHVHHGLQAQADAWDQHCRRVCATLGLPLEVRRVQVRRDSGEGLEAAARAARHAVFAQELLPNEWLATAHHRDDQAETFLLRALRASGPDGLAAMRPLRDYAQGKLWRPLLELPHARLLAYAQAHGLDWIEDPSNGDTRHDRNFLAPAGHTTAAATLAARRCRLRPRRRFERRSGGPARRRRPARPGDGAQHESTDALGHYADRLARRASGAGIARMDPFVGLTATAGARHRQGRERTAPRPHRR